MNIPTVPVKSNSIKAIGYHEPSKTLRVTFFHSNTTYDYTPVTAEEHQALIKAESVGRHFLGKIMPKKKHVRVS